MPDDHGRRFRPAPSPEPESEVESDLDRLDEDDDLHPPGEPNMTPELLAEIERLQLEEAIEIARAIDEGRMQGIPWEEARASVFAPLTPEELAALPPRRARR